MLIYDPIHGYIEVEGLFKSIINTQEFQRLKNVKQLGNAYLVFPTTNHTRFEHSLGAYYLASQFADQLQLNKEQTKKLKTAALLHDIGHGPFSHTIEGVYGNTTHEDISIKKIKSDPIKGILESEGIHPNSIEKLILGKGKLGPIIAGDIDVDRMDYLLRDSYYSGVAHGVIDSETIIRSAEFKGKDLVFSAKYKQALEGLLVGRSLMRSTIYFNETVLVADRMLQKAVSSLVNEENISVEQLTEMDDIDLISRLRSTNVPTAKYLNEKLYKRNLFKKAVEVPLGELSHKTQKLNANELEQALSEKLDLETKKIVVDLPYINNKSSEINIKIYQDEEIINLDSESVITKSTTQSSSYPNTLRIYCDKNLDKLQQHASQIQTML
ncbi:MAG: phosphodiesterase [Parcubacteria group bacterium QH_9_35_7]|nr:MAG: phosphodiesterase [Parcubacteria group bacterium QH_9_35_7]